MAGREFEEPKHRGQIDASEEVIAKVVTSKDLGQRLRIGMDDFFCVHGFKGGIALVKRIDDEHIGAFVGEEIGLTLSKSHNYDELIDGKVYALPYGFWWVYKSEKDSWRTQAYRHFDAELKRIGKGI